MIINCLFFISQAHLQHAAENIKRGNWKGQIAWNGKLQYLFQT